MRRATGLLPLAALGFAVLAMPIASAAATRQPAAPDGMHVVQSGGVMMLQLNIDTRAAIAPLPTVDIVGTDAGPMLVLRQLAGGARAAVPPPATTVLVHPDGSRELKLLTDHEPTSQAPTVRRIRVVPPGEVVDLLEPDVLYQPAEVKVRLR